MPVRLLDANGTLFVCDEYDPRDGRVHVLNTATYAIYDEAAGTLELHKAVIEITAVVYAGDIWPIDMPTPTGYPTVISYFSEET